MTPRLNLFSRRLPILLGMAAALLAGGCGGGSGNGGGPLRPTQAQIQFTWPAKTRLIPIATNAVKITLTGPNQTYTRTVSRPEATASQTTNITFDPVVAGGYTVTAEAFPNADGTGTVQASGSTSLTVTAGQANSFSVTMLSTVTRVVVSGPTNLTVGDSGAYTARAFDAANNEVLVDGSTWTWTAPNGTRISSTAGQNVRVKPLLQLSGNVTCAYSEPGGTPPSGSVSLSADDAVYTIGSILTGGGTDVASARYATDIIGDSVPNVFYVPNDLGAGTASVFTATPRGAPAWGSNLLTLSGSLRVISGVRDRNGVIYLAVTDGTTTNLYRGNRGQTPANAYALPNTVLDIAVDGNGNVIVLSDTGSARVVQRYSPTGVPTSLSIPTDPTTARVAADSDGNVYVDGTTVRRLSPTGVTSTPISGFSETVLDLAADDGNVYVLATPATTGQAHILFYTGEGDLLADFDTQAFFWDDDINCRLAVDPQTSDLYMARSYLDFSNLESFDVVCLAHN